MKIKILNTIKNFKLELFTNHLKNKKNPKCSKKLIKILPPCEDSKIYEHYKSGFSLSHIADSFSLTRKELTKRINYFKQKELSFERKKNFKMSTSII